MNSLIDAIGRVPFFHSLPFGLAAMMIVGASWCLVGIVMGDAPKNRISSGTVQLWGAVLSVTVSGLIGFGMTGTPECSFKVLFLTCGAYFLCGSLNFTMLQIMSYAMQRGPNGIIWSIIQTSPMIFPVIGTALIFGEQITAVRGGGIALMLLALCGFGFAKDNSVKDRQNGSWKIPAFICFAICAVQGNLCIAPSYFPEARAVNSIFRAMSFAGGTLTNALVLLLFHADAEKLRAFREECGKILLWKYVGTLQFFGLIFAYTLQYPGMNVMADHGYGGLCNSIMVGSCIVSFTILSCFRRKEKISVLQGVSLLLCISGLVLLCF